MHAPPRFAAAQAYFDQLDAYYQPHPSHQHYNPIRPSGFHQRESKDFHISRLYKLLADEVIAGDSLQDLKLFYDAILSHFNTVALTDTLFPNYMDLTTNFNFQDHPCPPTLPSGDLSQSIANYCSFGNSLH